VLTGAELHHLKLLYADNNAVVSPSQGRATIVVQADVEISGTIRVSTDSNLVVFGQSVNGSYVDGRVNLVRDVGKYGTVSVTWQILSSESLSTVLTQSSGSATFTDLQNRTTIFLQVYSHIK
jgi:hypothetical protein